VTVLREIPAYAAFYSGELRMANLIRTSLTPPHPGYEYTKRHLSRPDLLGDGMLTYMTSGAMGGISYWLACYPLDVVKSRVQLASKPPTPGGLPAIGYVGRELRAIVREGGV
jgi:solute carrier family 25 (mitochondrial carnitine/acylcarnitine transporter), member 20/29